MVIDRRDERGQRDGWADGTIKCHNKDRDGTARDGRKKEDGQEHKANGTEKTRQLIN